MFQRIIRLFRFVILLFVFACVAVFTASNSQDVTLSLFPLPFEASMPLSLVGIIAFIAGVLCCGLALSYRMHQARREAAIQKNKAEATANELEALKDQQQASRLSAMPSFPAVVSK